MKPSNLFLASLSLMISLLVAEFFCRAFIEVPVLSQNVAYPIYENDEELQWKLKSPLRYEGITVNSKGFRGKEIILKGQDDFNILAIGDSHTFGHKVSDKMAYPAQLASILNERYRDRPINVFNAGVPGYNTEQVLNNYKRISDQGIRFDLILFGIVIDDALP
jgi:hypothetical protein